MNKTATITAKLTLINANYYADEKSKEYSRLRMSKNTLRYLSGREHIRDVFVEELSEEFTRLGWHFFPHTDTEFGLIRADKVSVWAKIGPSRVRDLIDNMDAEGGDAVEVEFSRIFGGSDTDLIEDEDEVKPAQDDARLSRAAKVLARIKKQQRE